MSAPESVKWLSSGESGNVVVHKINKYFDSVAKEPCNLVSIFGRAREGKSFLMNALACRNDLFSVSNAHEPCTQGIDVSKLWMPLHDFSTADGGTIAYSSSAIKVGFLDAEGQGDKDVSYDSKLICPILLTSKCVIFNWKGDLQKDNILNTLGIMARAAQNIAMNSNEGKKSCFGHLHIVFRDWQAANSTSNSCLAVQDTLFSFEPSGAGHDERNRIRKLILEAFSSIRVWLFDPPSEYTKDLKQKLVYHNTSTTFRTQVRALREALAQQLKEPTYLAGNVLTGRTYIPLTENIAESLNSGQVVLPSAMYLNVVQADLRALAKAYRAELSDLASMLVKRKMQQAENAECGWAGACDFLLSNNTRKSFTKRSAPITAVYQSLGQDKLLNVAAAPGTPVAVILDEYAAQLQDIHTSSETQFLALYHQQCTQWLDATVPQKRADLTRTLGDAADVAEALLCQVSALDIGTLDSEEDPINSCADAVSAEVFVKMKTTVDEWLLLSLPKYANMVACDAKGVYSVAENDALEPAVKILLREETGFLNDLKEAIDSQTPPFIAQWRLELENQAYAASINTRSHTPSLATTAVTEQEGNEWSPLSDSLAGAGARGSPDNAVRDAFAHSDNIGEALRAEGAVSAAPPRGGDASSAEGNATAEVRRGSLTRAMGRLAVSIDQQRLRAQAWAQANLGLQFDTKTKTNSAGVPRSNSADITAFKPVRKSFAQQKSDALQYARKFFGARVVARELEDGKENDVDVANQSSSDDSFVHIHPGRSSSDDEGREEGIEEAVERPQWADSGPRTKSNGRSVTPVMSEGSDSEGEQGEEEEEEPEEEEEEEECEEFMSETVSEITGALRVPLSQLVRPAPMSYQSRSVSVPKAEGHPVPTTSTGGGGGRGSHGANMPHDLLNVVPVSTSPKEPTLLHFYKRCLADIYTHSTPRCDISRVQAVLAQDTHTTQTTGAPVSLKKFEAHLCRKIHTPSRNLAALLSENDCLFLGDVDFNTDRPSRASLNPHMHDRRSPSPDRRASFGGRGVTPLDETIDPVRERGHIIYKAGAYQVRFKDPVITKANCIFFHLFGRDRFVKVKVPPLSPRTIQGGLRYRSNQLLEDGFVFGGRTYHFLGGEGKDRSEGQAYFFATHDDCNLLSPISISEVRQALADFDQVGQASDANKPKKLMAASKINARLMLGFSPTHPALTLTDNQVIVIDDVAAEDGGQGGIMTDGCGFISASLLHDLPFAISNGAKFCERVLPTQNSYSFSNSEDSVSYLSTVEETSFPEDGIMRAVATLPNTIQIRLSCKKGLFKGCLTVTSDVRLCPENCVVMRQSMLKVSGPTHIFKNSPCTLFVNKTFEKAAALSPSSFRNAPAGIGGAGGGNPWTANFSVDLALLLCHLGLPLDHVLRLALREVEEISDISRNRSLALETVHRILRRFDRKDSDDADYCSDEDVVPSEPANVSNSLFGDSASSKESNDTDSTRSGSSSSESNTDFLSAKYSMYLTAESAAMKALHYFVAGHDLKEPQLQRYLSRLQTVALDKLRRLKFRLPQSAYLVGVPDPYGVLKEGEVFAYVPMGDAELRTSSVIHNCEVLVTRYPLHHPGDIRKLRAVQHDALSALVGHSSNAVLFFSTQGCRSQADKMGGGDFDGDEYCLIFNPAIVNAITTVEPYHASDFPPVTVAPAAVVKDTNMRDGLGVELLHSLLHHASNNKVGMYSTYWLAFADRDPASLSAKTYDHLARLALDAAKTGLECNSLTPPELTEKPHYLAAKLTNVKNVYQSESVVGVVTDMIAQRVTALQPLSAPPTADPDIYMVMENGEVIFDVVEEINHHLQRQLTGQEDKWDLWERWKSHFDHYRIGVGRLSSANENANLANNATLTGTSTSAGVINHVEEQMQSLKSNFIEAFDAEARSLHTLDPRYASFTGYNARRVLASIVYHLTYENCKSFANFYRVGFCWEVCPAELHDNKKRSMMRKYGQHECDLLSAMYIQDMYNLRFQRGSLVG